MNLLGVRCNPYGYGSDKGPKHLMGGVFGPEYAGDQNLVDADGSHGIGICERQAEGWFVATCANGHTGPKMPLCVPHQSMLQRRMLATCTACVMPPESRQLWEDQRSAEESLRLAYQARDERAVARYQGQIEDIGKAQVELTRRGLTPRVPMRLVEIS